MLLGKEKLLTIMLWGSQKVLMSLFYCFLLGVVLSFDPVAREKS